MDGGFDVNETGWYSSKPEETLRPVVILQHIGDSVCIFNCDYCFDERITQNMKPWSFNGLWIKHEINDNLEYSVEIQQALGKVKNEADTFYRFNIGLINNDMTNRFYGILKQTRQGDV